MHFMKILTSVLWIHSIMKHWGGQTECKTGNLLNLTNQMCSAITDNMTQFSNKRYVISATLLTKEFDF